jgi:hypothetical protein
MEGYLHEEVEIKSGIFVYIDRVIDEVDIGLHMRRQGEFMSRSSC